MTSNACQTGVTRENATFVTTARQIGARNVHPFLLVLAAPAATDCARVKDDSLVTPGLDTVLSIQDGQHACVPELAKTK
ncbi:hypothetical protein HYQ46_001153 [Verticillium longisporum]|nr:hypothetical protein HYQ46_001153 [Verticillium longisporum]